MSREVGGLLRIHPGGRLVEEHELGLVASARATSSRRWSPYGRFRASSSSRPRRLEKREQLAGALAGLASSRRIPGVRTIERMMPPFNRQCMPTSTFSSAVMC